MKPINVQYSEHINVANSLEHELHVDSQTAAMVRKGAVEEF